MTSVRGSADLPLIILLTPCVPFFFLCYFFSVSTFPFFPFLYSLPLSITHHLLLLASSSHLHPFSFSPLFSSQLPFTHNIMSLSLAAAIPRTTGRWVCSLSATRQRLFHSAATTRAAAATSQHLQPKQDYSQYGKVILPIRCSSSNSFFSFFLYSRVSSLT